MNKINVTRSSMPGFDEYCAEIRSIWDNHWLTNMGEKHQLLEEKLKDFLNCPNIVLYTNGHLALENIIAAMNFPVGSEIITTPFTFASTTHSITRNGLTPVFCDIDPDNYTIDVNLIESLITERTVAILPVHVYGNMCDVEKIDIIAKKHNLKVIYDAAHAFAVKYKGISSANFGDASMFSFHATKVFNTIEGGAVCFRDASLVNTLNVMKNFGISSPERVIMVGGNAKMNEFQAAMGICNLRHLDDEIRKRKKVVERYITDLRNVSGVKLCSPQKHVESNYAYFPILFDNFGSSRDEVFDALIDNGITARKYFYPLTNAIEAYADLPTAGAYKTPVAERVADSILTLPLYSDLSLNDVDRICSIIISCKN